MATTDLAKDVEGHASAKTVALALGGGGARGLAHIAILEAFDEIGVKPVAIAGSSIGAAIGAAYAAGMSGKAIRRYLISVVHDRPDVLRRIVAARAVAGLGGLLAGGLGNPMLLDALKFCDAFMPGSVPDDIRATRHSADRDDHGFARPLRNRVRDGTAAARARRLA